MCIFSFMNNNTPMQGSPSIFFIYFDVFSKPQYNKAFKLNMTNNELIIYQPKNYPLKKMPKLILAESSLFVLLVTGHYFLFSNTNLLKSNRSSYFPSRINFKKKKYTFHHKSLYQAVLPLEYMAFRRRYSNPSLTDRSDNSWVA